MVRTALTRSRGACLSPRPGRHVHLSTGYVLCYCATVVAVSELQSIREMGAGRDTYEQELHRPLPRPAHPHAPAGISPTTAEERGHLLAILLMAADWPPWVQIPGRAPWLPAPAGLSTQAHPRRLRHQGQPANPAPGPPAWTQAPGRPPASKPWPCSPVDSGAGPARPRTPAAGAPVITAGRPAWSQALPAGACP